MPPGSSSSRRSGRGDLAKAGELAYGVIPELETKLKEIEEAEDQGGDWRRRS